MTELRDSLPPGDYVSPNLQVVRPDAAFPFMVLGDKGVIQWPFFRPRIPHNWYVDSRASYMGFVSRDEASILYNTGLMFRGQWGLEIGCWLGWSACHLALSGLMLDVVDPVVLQPEVHASIVQSLTIAGVLESVHLTGGSSPAAVEQLASSLERTWSFFFIDGDHEGDAPLLDAQACHRFAEPDALVAFHDLAAPAVGRGLDFLREQGWNTLVYQTMQIMGVAWRGDVTPIVHHPDPTVDWELPTHLLSHPVSR